MHDQCRNACNFCTSILALDPHNQADIQIMFIRNHQEMRQILTPHYSSFVSAFSPTSALTQDVSSIRRLIDCRLLPHSRNFFRSIRQQTFDITCTVSALRYPIQCNELTLCLHSSVLTLSLESDTAQLGNEGSFLNILKHFKNDPQIQIETWHQIFMFN